MPKMTKAKENNKGKMEEEKVSKKLSQTDYEKKVVDLAKKGLTSEKIGETLRKEEIHPSKYGKKISIILKEKEIYVNPDLKNIEKKLEEIKKHYEKNKQDKRAMRERDRIAAKIRKIKKYLKVQ